MRQFKSTVSSTNVEFEIVHAVGGRLRLRLKSDRARELLPRLAHHLRQQGGILRVQIRPTSNSLVVVFDADVISLKQLTDSLQAWGFSQVSTEEIEPLNEESLAMTYSRLFSLIPPLVGLAIARSLQVSGWKSILTYILAAGVTREVIDQVTGKSEAAENVKLSTAKKVSTIEVAEEKILPILTAIETDYEIVHQIPGRIRLRVPQISRARAVPAKAESNYAQELKHLLKQDNRIIDIRINNNSSSVVILYDREALSDSNQKKVALIESEANKVIQSVAESPSSTYY